MPPTSTERIDALIARLAQRVGVASDDKTQDELGRLIRVLPELQNAEHAPLLALAELAATSLLADTPNVRLAKELNDEMASRLSRGKNPFFSILRGGSPAARVTLGLGVLLYFGLPAAYWLWLRTRGVEKIFGIDAQLLALVAETQRLTRLYEQKQAALAALTKSLLHQAFTGEL